jgi:hypothetical protein
VKRAGLREVRIVLQRVGEEVAIHGLRVAGRRELPGEQPHLAGVEHVGRDRDQRLQRRRVVRQGIERQQLIREVGKGVVNRAGKVVGGERHRRIEGQRLFVAAPVVSDSASDRVSPGSSELLMMIAPAIFGRASGDASSALTWLPPDDWPKMVMRSLSPPNLSMFRRTQSSAAMLS